MHSGIPPEHFINIISVYLKTRLVPCRTDRSQAFFLFFPSTSLSGFKFYGLAWHKVTVRTATRVCKSNLFNVWLRDKSWPEEHWEKMAWASLASAQTRPDRFSPFAMLNLSLIYGMDIWDFHMFYACWIDLLNQRFISYNYRLYWHCCTFKSVILGIY